MGEPRRRFRFLVPLVVALHAAAGSTLVDAGLHLESIETANLRLIYPGPTLGFVAPYTAQCFENSLRFHRRLFDYTPGEKVTVLLVDDADFGNAGVTGSPRNTMSVQIAPTNFVYETAPSNERINFLMNHELAHVVTLDRATGRDVLFRRLFFGKVRETPEHPVTILYNYLTVPRRAAPRWHREGTAVFLETWMSGGFGRAQGPYDEMVFRAMVRDRSHIYDPLGLESQGTKVDFQVGANAYLYGTRFMSWMTDRFGPPAFVDWVARRPHGRAYYAGEFQRLTGMTVSDGWREWIAHERAFQTTNLDSVRRHPVTPYRDLSQRALGSVSPACLDTASRTLYAGVFYPGRVAHIAAIPLDGGPARELQEVKGPAIHFVCSLAWDPARRRLFYTNDNNNFRDLCELDPATGRTRRLMRDARLGDLAFNRADSSLWAVRHFNGLSTIVRIPSPYTDYKRVATFPFGNDVYDLDISADGSRLSLSMAHISGRQTLRLYPLTTFAGGDTSGRTLYDFGTSIPTSFVFSRDGRYLFGSSYYTGVSNVFRYDLAADSMDIVTNAEVGFFRPLQLRGDSLVVFRYSGGGFVPAVIEAKPLTDVSAIAFYGQQIVERHPELKTWRVPPPSSIHLDSLITYQGPYRPLRSVRMVSLYPAVEGYKDHTALGLQARFSDPIALHDLSATGSYTAAPDLAADERWHATVAYKHLSWNAKLRYNPASFYDLFGPTKTSRKGTGVSLGWSRPLIRDDPHTLDLEAGVNGWTGLERLPDAQNVSISPGFDKLLSGSAALHDKNTRSSIGALDAEKGWKWGLGIATDGVRFERGGKTTWRGFHSLEASGDVGTPLPLPNASLWLRIAAGFSPGDRFEPFANFFFGGFGNNWVDHQDVKRYRESSSFPGTELDAIAGTNYARAMLDWNLPPLRFERVGIPGGYASWVRTSVFGSLLSANLDDAATRRTLGNVGIQSDLRIMLLSHQSFTLSVGYARAFERREPTQREWMVSLKVL